MYDLFFSHNSGMFTVPAILGTVIFGLRMLMLLMGGDDGEGLDFDGGDAGDVGFDAGDADVGANHAHDDGGANPDRAFSVISLNTIAAFLMGGGWAGLGAYRGSGATIEWSIAIGVVGGLAMVWLFGWLMKAVYDLQGSGNISIRSMLGREAEVDVSVPGNSAGQGTVKVIFDERMRRYQAVTAGEPLERGATVRVEKINADNTVTVIRA